MSLHSTTLLPGATPFVRTDEDRRRLLDGIDAFLEHCRGRGFRFGTLSEAAERRRGATRGGGHVGSGAEQLLVQRTVALDHPRQGELTHRALAPAAPIAAPRSAAPSAPA